MTGLDQLKDALKTSNATAPASLGGVRSQARYYNAGQSGGGGASEPSTRLDAQKADIDAATRLSDLQRQASKMQIGAEQANLLVEAGKAEDASDLQHRQVDAQEGDALGAISRGVAGVGAIGQAVGRVAKKVGADGLVEFLDKIPLVGRSKEIKAADALYEQSIEAMKEGNQDRIALLKENARLYGTILTTWNRLESDMADRFTPEMMESVTPDPTLMEAYDSAITAYADAQFPGWTDEGDDEVQFETSRAGSQNIGSTFPGLGVRRGL